MGTRARIKRSSLYRDAVCSSDNYKVSRKAHLALLEENHNSFITTQYAKDIEKEVKEELNDVSLTPAKVKAIYKEVKVMGTWDKLSKYLDMIPFMISNNYQFR